MSITVSENIEMAHLEQKQTTDSKESVTRELQPCLADDNTYLMIDRCGVVGTCTHTQKNHLYETRYSVRFHVEVEQFHGEVVVGARGVLGSVSRSRVGFHRRR